LEVCKLTDTIVAIIEKNDCIYEFIQGDTHKKYESELYNALANAIFESENHSQTYNKH
jgi:hypothetical protein